MESIHSIEAEKMVLGCLLQEPELLIECQLHENHFMLSKHKNLIHIMRKMSEKNEPISLPTVALKTKEKVEKIGGFEYLNEIEGSVPSGIRFDYFQSIVLENYNKRKIIEGIGTAMKQADEGEDAAAIVATLEKATQIETTQQLEDTKTYLAHLYDHLYEPKENKNVMTKMNDLDKLLNGYKETQLVIIGARPSVGKTAYALNQQINIARANENNVCAFFSLEMSKEQLFSRVISIISDLNTRKMSDPLKLFNESDHEKVAHAFGVLDSIADRFYVYDNMNDLDQIARECRRLKRQHGDKNVVVFIDYLQLVTHVYASKNANRQQIVGEISKTLKRTALSNKITIVALSQLSRDLERRNDKRPMLADLRESGDLEQDADIVQFLYREDYHDKSSEQKGATEIIIAKHRNGSIGVVQMLFIKEYSKFINMEK